MDGLSTVLNIVREDVSKLIDLETRIKNLPPVHRAAATENVAELEELLRSGEDPDDQDGTLFGPTAVHWAAGVANKEVMELLDKYGANMSAVDEIDQTPLHFAAMVGNIETLIWLLDNTQDIEAKEVYHQTALHLAAFNGKLGATKILLRYGASLDAVDAFGMTPLCIAVVLRNFDVATLFLKKGANPKVYDTRGNSLLHFAAANDDELMIKMIIDIGVDINCENDLNLTPLHEAAKRGRYRALSILLESGADIEAKDKKGQTAWYKAEKAGHVQCARLLADRGADRTVIPKDSSVDLEYQAPRSEAYLYYLEENGYGKNNSSDSKDTSMEPGCNTKEEITHQKADVKEDSLDVVNINGMNGYSKGMEIERDDSDVEDNPMIESQVETLSFEEVKRIIF